MKLVAFGHAFDRLHVTAFGIQPEHQARKNRPAINQDRAGSALTQLTAVLGSGQSQDLHATLRATFCAAQKRLRSVRH